MGIQADIEGEIMNKRRKATVFDMIKLPDYMKIKLWDDHAEIILEACEFGWEREE